MLRRVPVLLCALALLSAGCGRLEPISTAEALDRLTVATSKVYDSTGNVIANLHGEINRDILKLNQMPKSIRDAVVAVEDERFWSHQGLDLRSIIRAATRNAQRESTTVQGGSTISQQLAKNLYFGPKVAIERDAPFLPARTLSRKLSETRITWQLENAYTKPEILEMYLNTIYLGRGMYGIETAARSYFDKPASELTLPESAFLVGLIHEPARYEWKPSDPRERQESRLEDATRRRDYALGRMHGQDMITDEEFEEAKATPLEVRPAEEQRWKHPYFVDLVLRQLGVLSNSESNLLDQRFDFLGTSFPERARNVYLRGLRIYTTLDPKAQNAAEKAVKEVLPDIPKMWAALASIEPGNGYLRALVGGRGYYPDCEKKEEQGTHACKLAKVNLALGRYGGGSGRQPGSSFKPFVLAAALQRGVSLHQAYPSDPFVHPIANSEPWRVGNYSDGAGGGNLTLLDGTARSVNAVFAHLMIDGVGDGDPFEGSKRVATLARRLGISFPTPEQLKDRCGEDFNRTNPCIPADNVPSVALGAKEASPLDMASAYSAFANDGVRYEPTTIVRIDDAEGRVLYRADPASVRAVPTAVARGVTHALKGVFTRGTGRAAAIDRPAAGKTGTSQAHRDAWLAGYTPELATVVWVGNPLSLPTGPESMVPRNGYPRLVTGGSFPAMIWQQYMTDALQGVPARDFRPPPQAVFKGAAAVVPSPTPSPSGSPDPDASPTGAPGSVPSVIGLNYGRARSAIQQAGFGAAVVRGCNPDGDTPLHDVYSQSPEAGAEVPTGSTVTAYYQGGGCD